MWPFDNNNDNNDRWKKARELTFRDDADRFGNGFGSDRMVTGYHDDLDAGGTALGDRVGHRSPRRVDHRHQADEAEPVDREVRVVAVELEADRELVGRQYEVAEAEHTFTKATELQVSVVERLLHLFVEHLLLTADEDGGATIEDPLGRALHHEKVSRIVRIVRFVDRDLILVGRVERYLADLLVTFPDAHHVAESELHALQQGGLRRVAVHFPLQYRLVVLADLELGTVAQGGDFRERLETRAGTIVLEPGLILRRVRLDDLIVEPHVSDGHAILRERAGLVRADGRRWAQCLDSL